ncbi:hypothetical protein MYX82_09945 [Acidobacteria bacterium AH-259-D05]|nr:hypothetical protein [Acidobacteria bacterium AH-259-D05]
MKHELTQKERRSRDLLIRVAQGRVRTHRAGYISYKEFWQCLYSRPWGQYRRKEIVRLVTSISGYDLARGRPPLNELVIRKGRTEPGEEWQNIRSFLKKTYGVEAPYQSHHEAQEACWQFWGKKKSRRLNDHKAEEGVQQDKTGKFQTRNAKVVTLRKKRDDYTCQACGFRLKVNGKYIIDCHHKNPLGGNKDVRVTHIDDLVCLCPTCHRIAHSRSYPLTVHEIKHRLKSSPNKSLHRGAEPGS